MPRIKTKDKRKDKNKNVTVNNKQEQLVAHTSGDSSVSDLIVFICLCIAGGILGYVAVVLIPAFISKGVLS